MKNASYRMIEGWVKRNEEFNEKLKNFYFYLFFIHILFIIYTYRLKLIHKKYRGY